MNFRLFDPTRYLLFSISFFLLLWGEMRGQGFIGVYPTQPLAYFGAQSIYPKTDGGFQLTTSSYQNLLLDTILVRLDVDASGQITGSDTTKISFGFRPEIFMQENGGYLSAYSDYNQLKMNSIAANGDTLWHNTVTFPGWPSTYIISMRPNSTGELFVHGIRRDNSSLDSGFIAKFSNSGALLWKNTYGTNSYYNDRPLIPTLGGGCLFSYATQGSQTSLQLLNFDGNGSLLWSVPYRSWSGLDRNTFAFSPYNQVIYTLFFNNSADLIVKKTHINGLSVGEVNLCNLLGMSNLGSVMIVPTADSGFVSVIENYTGSPKIRRAVRINALGEIVWQKVLPFFSGTEQVSFAEGKELSDGSVVIYGGSVINYIDPSQLIFIKISPDGTIYPNRIVGQVRNDSSYDCLLDPTEPGLSGWVTTATSNGLTQYATTDAQGYYTFSDIDTGTYLLKVMPPNYLWQPCTDSLLLTFSDTVPSTDTADFPVQAVYNCPVMQVDIGVGALRPCSPAIYTAHWCNLGSQPATPALFAIQLNPLLVVTAASIPYTQLGDTLWFDLGATPPGACGDILIYGSVSCDAALGQSLCSTAYIFPDTVCAPNLPNWSGARIEVSAVCTGDSVRMAIQNTGNAPTSQALDFIVIDDHVITRQGTFNLQPGEVQYDIRPADGSTWRLIAEQEPGFPFGLQMPSVGIEGCTVSGIYTSGWLNLFPNYSGNPFSDIACQVVVGSYDPNDKQAFPVGVDDQHLIEPNTPVDYQIRFQNTGTDTAFTVVVKDTLSPWLDPATVRPGAASHPYTWTLSGAGILTFTFNNILLPDSNVNELASHGFIQFHIDQQKDVPLGTLLENRAGIYFDFNEPVMTNTVWHTIGREFLPTATHEPGIALPSLQVWPNPASQSTRIWAEKPFESGQRLVLRDALGRVVREMAVQGQTMEVQRAGLPTGLYFLELRGVGRTLAVGKVVWE